MSEANYFDGNLNYIPIGGVLYWAGLDSKRIEIEETTGFMRADGRALPKKGNEYLLRCFGNRYDNPGTPPPAGTFQIPDLIGWQSLQGAQVPPTNLLVGCPNGSFSVGIELQPSNSNFATATFSIKPENLPTFACDYTASSYAGTNQYYRDITDSVPGIDPPLGRYENQPVWTDSNPTGRAGGSYEYRFVRDDIGTSSDGKFNSATVDPFHPATSPINPGNPVNYPDFAPQVYYDNGAVPTDPVDVFADITAPAGYVAPSFNIVPLIRVK